MCWLRIFRFRLAGFGIAASLCIQHLAAVLDTTVLSRIRWYITLRCYLDTYFLYVICGFDLADSQSVVP
jgi:hypothetical protein